MLHRAVLAAELHTPTFVALVALSRCGLPQIGGERPDMDQSWPREFQALLSDCWSGDPSRRPDMTGVRFYWVWKSNGSPLWVVETARVSKGAWSGGYFLYAPLVM